MIERHRSTQQKSLGLFAILRVQLGIGIAMDDFGAGHSSLSYLRKFSFNTLKIDRSFVHDITVDPADRELVNAAIARAHGLGLEVVAEGVGTQEQFDYLERRGCDFAQGYLYSKPIPSEEIPVLLERHDALCRQDRPE